MLGQMMEKINYICEICPDFDFKHFYNLLKSEAPDSALDYANDMIEELGYIKDSILYNSIMSVIKELAIIFILHRIL